MFCKQRHTCTGLGLFITLVVLFNNKQHPTCARQSSKRGKTNFSPSTVKQPFPGKLSKKENRQTSSFQENGWQWSHVSMSIMWCSIFIFFFLHSCLIWLLHRLLLLLLFFRRQDMNTKNFNWNFPKMNDFRWFFALITMLTRVLMIIYRIQIKKMVNYVQGNEEKKIRPQTQKAIDTIRIRAGERT